MKKLFPCVTVITILWFSQLTFSSCSKTVTKTVTDTVTKVVTPISSLLLGKQWIVDSLYVNYTASNPGTLAYVRGGSNNTQNLDNFIVIMWPDLTQLFINGNSNSTYTFAFQNSDSTQLLIHNPNVDYARIVYLSEKYLTIYDSTNSALSYYIYKP